jgi:RNA polymerase sigma-70 factor (ECF subfamily)
MQSRRATQADSEQTARSRPAPAEDPELEFTRIVRQYEQRVRSVLRGRGVAERDLPDAQQDVFLVVHRKLPQFERRSSLATWLHRIALNVASEHRRRARNRYERPADLPQLERSAGDPHEALEARNALTRVQRALAALSEPQRDVFLLHEVAGLSMHEVAAQLAIPLKTAFSRLYAARRALAAELAGRGGVLAAMLAWVAALAPARASARAQAAIGHGGAWSATAVPVHAAAAALVLTALGSLLLAPAPAAVLAHPGLAEPPAQRWVHSATCASSGERAEHADAALPAVPSGASAAPARSSARAAMRTPLPPAAPPSLVPAPGSAAVAEVLFSDPAAGETDEFSVTRSGAHDLRPRLAHPLAQRVEAPPAAPRIRVEPIREPAEAIEDALR